MSRTSQKLPQRFDTPMADLVGSSVIGHYLPVLPKACDHPQTAHRLPRLVGEVASKAASERLHVGCADPPVLPVMRSQWLVEVLLEDD